MKSPLFGALVFLVLPLMAHSDQSYYCPQNHAYIHVGMRDTQVIAACGQPSFVKTSNNPVMQKIPATQLIYTTLNQGAIYQGLTPVYNMWSLASGSVGTSLEINIIDNKVSSMKINGSSTNAITICGGNTVQVGDDPSNVYSACGSPSLVNYTYINKPVPSNAKPEVWTYQIDQYQAPISLTFVNSTLQSID